MVKRIAGALALLALTGCSVAVEGKMRASMLKFMDRETKPEVDAVETEQAIVRGLIVEANGDDVLALAYLRTKGYSDDEASKRVAIVRAKSQLATRR